MGPTEDVVRQNRQVVWLQGRHVAGVGGNTTCDSGARMRRGRGTWCDGGTPCSRHGFWLRMGYKHIGVTTAKSFPHMSTEKEGVARTAVTTKLVLTLVLICMSVTEPHSPWGGMEVFSRAHFPRTKGRRLPVLLLKSLPTAHLDALNHGSRPSLGRHPSPGNSRHCGRQEVDVRVGQAHNGVQRHYGQGCDG